MSGDSEPEDDLVARREVVMLLQLRLLSQLRRLSRMVPLQSMYVFVYKVHPLTEGNPAFCLACLGIDSKFSTDLVLNRWQMEC